MLPGKKGIALTPDQFDTLHREVANISDALEGNDSTFELPLGNKYVPLFTHPSRGTMCVS